MPMPTRDKLRVNMILVVNKLQIEHTIRMHTCILYEYVCMYICVIGYMHLWAPSATKFYHCCCSQFRSVLRFSTNLHTYIKKRKTQRKEKENY